MASTGGEGCGIWLLVIWLYRIRYGNSATVKVVKAPHVPGGEHRQGRVRRNAVDDLVVGLDRPNQPPGGALPDKHSAVRNDVHRKHLQASKQKHTLNAKRHLNSSLSKAKASQHVVKHTMVSWCIFQKMSLDK